MNLTLNIGLEVSERFSVYKKPTPAAIKAELKKAGIKPVQVALKQSATEKTLVIKAETSAARDEIRAKLKGLATRFGQDCLAVKDDSGNGSLIGEYAHLWGEFNDNYFLDIN